MKSWPLGVQKRSVGELLDGLGRSGLVRYKLVEGIRSGSLALQGNLH